MDSGRPILATYLDSSALVRLIVREGDVGDVEAAMHQGPTSSVLAKLEMQAAIYKRWHDRLIDAAARDGFLAGVASDIEPVLAFTPLDGGVFVEARAVVQSYSLRTLDAIHLATARIVERRAKRHGARFHFCTADRRQAAAAEAVFGAERVMMVPPWR